MNQPACDPRGICNLMLDLAERNGWALTNLALQKLLYFAHGLFLVVHKRPLVTGYFEAWRYGPVHPAAYAAFKRAVDQPIEFRASGVDILTGAPRAIPTPTAPEVSDIVGRIVNMYAGLTPGRLVDISHAPGAPWSVVVARGDDDVAFGLRIPDALIVERFKHHKVAVGEAPKIGEPRDEAPFNP